MSDMKKLIESIDRLTECPPMEGGTMPPAPTNPGNPVTVSVSLNASGMDHVADLMRLLQQAGLEQAGPVSAPTMPMRQDMDRLRAIVSEPEMEADAAYGDVITDDESLDEADDAQSLMGQIRKMAKGVETNPDEQAHRIFAQQVESNLIDLFQMTNSEEVRNLIRQNKPAQREVDRRNANNIATTLWDIMNSNEGLEEYDNEPNPEYQDHKYMTKDLSGGLNREKGAYAAAQPGDNAMAVEGVPDLSPKFIKHLQVTFGDKAILSSSETRKIEDMIDKLSIENLKTLVSADIPNVSDMAKDYLRNNTPGGMKNYSENDDDTTYTIRGKNSQAQSELARRAGTAGDEDMVEAIKKTLMAALSEKKAKPDFLDVDKDGDKKEPMKKALKDAGKGGSKPKKGEVPPQFKKKTNEADYNTIAGLARLKMQHDAEKKYKDSMSKKKESAVSEISSDLAKRYTKNAKMDRDFNDDDIKRQAKSGQSTQDMQRRNSKRTKGINQAKKRMD